ncbi:hypothetical protein [Streptomyces tanashiensis]|nr:hypothetical protein [Streptomyces tanashiensis]
MRSPSTAVWAGPLRPMGRTSSLRMSSSIRANAAYSATSAT